MGQGGEQPAAVAPAAKLKTLGAQAKKMAQKDWYDELRMVGTPEHYSWLSNLPGPIDRIANFGCWSGSEPFALIWTLDAHEIAVVEVEEKYLSSFDEQMEILRNRHPQSLADRKIQALRADMKRPIPDLQDQYYDLAFCEDVLYSVAIQGGEEAVDRSINQMIRVVSEGRFIVAVEPKYGVKFKKRESSRLPISTPIPLTESIDMSNLFLSKGLTEIQVEDRPSHSYCYRKIRRKI